MTLDSGFRVRGGGGYEMCVILGLFIYTIQIYMYIYI